MGWLADETGLERNPANYTALTPLSHLARAARVYADRTAVVWKDHRVSWAREAERVSRLASGLRARGIRPGDVVATLMPNVPAQVDAHWGVPACGAVLNTINTRLDAGTVAYIFGHAGAKLVLVDTALIPLAEEALGKLEGERPGLIECVDQGFTATGRHPTYDALLAAGDPDFVWEMPEDEWESISIN